MICGAYRVMGESLSLSSTTSLSLPLSLVCCPSLEVLLDVFELDELVHDRIDRQTAGAMDL